MHAPFDTDFNQFVRAALQTLAYDVEKTKAFVLARLKNDKVLFEALIDKAIRYSIAEKTMHAARDEQRAIVHSTPRRLPRIAENYKTVNAVKDAMSRCWLEFRLWGGSKLGDADRKELEQSAGNYATQSSDMSKKARWLFSIAAKLPEGKIVRDVLSEEQVSALWSEA
jgi:hypothetical protein